MDMTSTALMTTASLADIPDFAIGDALVSPATRTICGPGGSMQVEPRVMQVLVVLAHADGAVVTRDKLLARCWGGVYVGDDSLNRAIAGVRRIGSAIAGGSFEIETIPRTGYRLITRGSVSPWPLATAHSDASLDRGEALGRGVERRWLLAGGLAAAAGFALWRSRPGEPDAVARLMDDSRVAMRAGTAAKAREAIDLLRKAVVLAPDNAEAWALLALTLARADEHAIDTTISPAGEVAKAANRALQLDSGNADASAALAIAVPYYGDWLNAERRFDNVLRQHPDHLYTRDSRAFFFGAVGLMRKSAEERLTFSHDDAYDANLQYRHIYALWFLGRIADADRAASRGLEMWPGHPGIWFGRLWVLTGTGRFDRALAHVADASSRPPLPPQMIEVLRVGIGAARTRRPTEVAAATKLIMASVTHSVAAVVNAMMLLNLMGATDDAFELARAYYLEEGPIIAAMEWRPGQPIVPDQRRRKTNMLFTPTASAMQKDPRFLPLMEQMGLTDYWKRRGVVPDFLAR
jgi:DNA-binding winged helix-turn-helix (wHTH) protein/tetratricopeptide (TPR) repeat protein